jgi:ATPase family associated with various cellular activities (AAA)
MTNADAAAHRGLARAAASLEDEERGLTMLAAFGRERLIAGARTGGALDRSLTLAATVALADIAWRLHGADPAGWAKPEAGLAFERLADLSARVGIDVDRLELLLPLGPRARSRRRRPLRGRCRHPLARPPAPALCDRLMPAHPSVPPQEPAAMRHLRLWLGALDRVIAAALEVQAERAAALTGRQIAAHAITPDHAQLLAEQGAAFFSNGYPLLPAVTLDGGEAVLERALLSEEQTLPLARRATHLARHERSALLICAAAALSPIHERLFAYLVDDMARPHVSVELLLLLTAGETASEPIRRHDFGPGGRLARLGLVTVEGPAGSARAIVRPRDPVLAWLGGARRTAPLRLADPDLIATPAALPLPEGAETALAIAILEAGEGLVAIWGPGDRAALAEGIAAAAGRPLRRIAPARAQPLDEAIEDALARAAGEDAIAWLDLDGLPAAESAADLDRLGALLAGRTQPILLSGRTPWRPPAVLHGGRYAELAAAEIDSATAAGRLAARAGIDYASARDLTGRYRFTDSQQRILAALAGARDVESAARMAAATVSTRFATLIEPRRGPDDLVLPAALHRQVVEIASFFAAAPVVDGRFGFGRLSAAPGAIKVLFTGDPGTGKTLAAEVVARLLGRQLLKVDLAQVTSKWVGETEKNLEAVFEIAEQTAAVLFFDEADTLFGKRGECVTAPIATPISRLASSSSGSRAAAGS